MWVYKDMQDPLEALPQRSFTKTSNTLKRYSQELDLWRHSKLFSDPYKTWIHKDSQYPFQVIEKTWIYRDSEDAFKVLVKHLKRILSFKDAFYDLTKHKL